YFDGVNVGGGVGTVSNSGTIVGALDGVDFSSANSTLTNSGTIGATTGNALNFTGSGNRLVAEPGAVFSGHVGGGSGNTLELAPGSGSIAGFGTSFSGFSTLTFDPGAAWRVNGFASGFSAATITGF